MSGNQNQAQVVSGAEEAEERREIETGTLPIAHDA